MSVSLNGVPGLIQAHVPPGSIIAYAAAVAPNGWLLCDGSSYNRLGTYGDLYNIIGTLYGNNDLDTFRVPDIRGRVVAGYGNENILEESYQLGNTTGHETVPLSSAHVPKWYIQTSTAGDDGEGDGWGAGYGFNQKNGKLYPTYYQGGDNHENTQPTIILNYIIKY